MMFGDVLFGSTEVEGYTNPFGQGYQEFFNSTFSENFCKALKISL